MKKYILNNLLISAAILFVFTSFSQTKTQVRYFKESNENFLYPSALHHLVVSVFNSGITDEDSTDILVDTTLSTLIVIDIFKESLIYCTGNDFETFHFLTPLPTAIIEIESYESINANT